MHSLRQLTVSICISLHNRCWPPVLLVSISSVWGAGDIPKWAKPKSNPAAIIVYTALPHVLPESCFWQTVSLCALKFLKKFCVCWLWLLSEVNSEVSLSRRCGWAASACAPLFVTLALSVGDPSLNTAQVIFRSHLSTSLYRLLFHLWPSFPLKGLK